MNPRPSDDLQRRIYELVDETLHSKFDEAATAELQRLLSESDLARRYYRAALADAAHLRRWATAEERPLDAALNPPAGLDVALLAKLFRSERPDDAPRPQLAPPPATRSFRWQSHPVPFTAAVLALTVGAWFLLLQIIAQRQPVAQRPTPPGGTVPLVARITGLEACHWEQSKDAAPFLGAHLRRDQRLELLAGTAEVTFDNGAVILLEGPAQFVVTSSQAGQLVRGKLTAHVPEAARGFAVRAAGGTVVDLGTEFGIEVAASGEAQVHVFKGHVTVTLASRDGHSRLFDLRDDQALHWHSPDDEPQRMVARADQFIPVTRHDLGLLRPRALVSTDYHVPHLSGSRVGGGFSREWAFTAVTNHVTSHHFDYRDGYDTVGIGPKAQARTDFTGLLYERRARFDRLIVHMGGQAHDGGSWRELPSVFILTEDIDTNQTPPETHPAWRRIDARLTLGPEQFDPEVDPDPGAMLVFDLTTVPAAQRTGYGWAVGGVDGDGIGFILITELAAFGAPAEPDEATADGSAPELP